MHLVLSSLLIIYLMSVGLNVYFANLWKGFTLTKYIGNLVTIKFQDDIPTRETCCLANTSTTKTKTLRETNLHVRGTVQKIGLMCLSRLSLFWNHLITFSTTLELSQCFFYITINRYFYNLIWREHRWMYDYDVWKGNVYEEKKVNWRKKY